MELVSWLPDKYLQTKKINELYLTTSNKGSTQEKNEYGLCQKFCYMSIEKEKDTWAVCNHRVMMHIGVCYDLKKCRRWVNLACAG